MGLKTQQKVVLFGFLLVFFQKTKDYFDLKQPNPRKGRLFL
jgi:hypothetical protein